MMHYRVMKSIKVRLPDDPSDQNSNNEAAVVPETNLSNQWRIYAKMEANYHLSNKFALFFRM